MYLYSHQVQNFSFQTCLILPKNMTKYLVNYNKRTVKLLIKCTRKTVAGILILNTICNILAILLILIFEIRIFSSAPTFSHPVLNLQFFTPIFQSWNFSLLKIFKIEKWAWKIIN